MGSLKAEVQQKRLQDRARDAVPAQEGAEEDGGETHEFAGDDAEEGHVAIDYETGVQGAEAEGEDAYEREEPDY